MALRLFVVAGLCKPLKHLNDWDVWVVEETKFGSRRKPDKDYGNTGDRLCSDLTKTGLGNCRQQSGLQL